MILFYGLILFFSIVLRCFSNQNDYFEEKTPDYSSSLKDSRFISFCDPANLLHSTCMATATGQLQIWRLVIDGRGSDWRSDKYSF